MNRIRQYILAHKWLFIIVIVIVAGVLYLNRGKPQTAYDTVAVARGAVLQEVSVTGRVSANNIVDLAFEKGGRVVSTPRPVGAVVKQGDILVRIDSSELAALRTQAAANLEFEKANLASLVAGARPEDIAVSRSQVDSATGAVNDSRSAALDKLRVAYTTSDDVVHNTIDQFFRDPRTSHPALSFASNDAKAAADLESRRIALEAMLVSWSSDVTQWDAATDATVVINETEGNLGQVKTFLDELASMINALLPTSQVSQPTIDSWKLDISTARMTVNSAITNTFTVGENYRSAAAALRVAEDQLTFKSAGPTPDAVAAEEAKIAAVNATIQNYDAQIAKTQLRAPWNGVVTKQDAKLGETVAPNAPIVSLMSEGVFKIEANVPEVDVAKVVLGDLATVTLDAYGSDVDFAAVVSAIDPAETIIEGVSTYKVTLQFAKNDPRVRSGMTANIIIGTARRDDVLRIPARAITTSSDGKKTVQILEAGVPKTIPVEVGLRGSDGTIEVTTGLSEGDKVITFTP